MPFIENNPNIILQQDNPPFHTSNIVKTFMEDNNIKKIQWPANSSDLNIIENAWSILKFK